MNAKHEITMMNPVLHWMLTVLTFGMFPSLWFAWARTTLDGMVPGKRIPRWGPVTSFCLWMLGAIAMLLAIHPVEFIDRFYGLELEQLMMASRLLISMSMTVNVIMSYVAGSIIEAYADENLELGMEVSGLATLAIGSIYVQHKLVQLERYAGSEL